MLATEPVSVEVGRWVIGTQTLAVALADLGENVYPVPRLDAVVSLDVESPLWLNDLEHLPEKRKKYRERGETGEGWEMMGKLDQNYSWESEVHVA